MQNWQLSESQLQALQNIISAIVGAGSTLGVQWINSRRTKSQEVNDNIDVITKAATENVKTAQDVIDMLQEMLDKKDDQFKKEIQIAKDSCTEQIKTLKTESEGLVSDLEARVIALTREKETLTNEISSLNHQITKLTFNRNVQEEQVMNLMETLMLKVARYEDEVSKLRKENENETKDLKIDEEISNDVDE